jgi:hypothetical protein
MNHERIGADLRGSSLDAVSVGEDTSCFLPELFALERTPVYTMVAEDKTAANASTFIPSVTGNGTVMQLYKQYAVIQENVPRYSDFKEILQCFIDPLTSCIDNGVKKIPLQNGGFTL